ncbi:MAG: hypothetical protein H6741_00525 [Alphaproteobacteria bacterium]|nr:hypothetical protein [Alphaproteobacteria bacterium]MCB9791189.1 hypothetical protein [Alphaproteobacteria bacterium]
MLLFIAMTWAGAAQAGDLDVGVGLRDPHAVLDLPSQGSKAFGGVQGLVRYHIGWLSLEADVYYNPFSLRYSELDEVLVHIAGHGDPDVDFQVPLYNETLSLQALAGLGLPRDTEARWAGGPLLLCGFWGGLVQEAFLSADPNDAEAVQVSEAGRTLRVGPALGLGMEGWYEGRVGLRMSWMARLAAQGQPTYDPNQPADGNTLVNYQALTLDLMVNL